MRALAARKLCSTGACTAITLRMYAERQGWPLAGIAEKTPVTWAVKAGTEIRTATGIR